MGKKKKHTLQSCESSLKKINSEHEEERRGEGKFVAEVGSRGMDGPKEMRCKGVNNRFYMCTSVVAAVCVCVCFCVHAS